MPGTPDARAVLTPIRVTEGVGAGFLAHWQQADISRTLVFGGINTAGLGLRLAGTPVVGLFDKEMLVTAGGFCSDVLNPENHWAVQLQDSLPDRQSTCLACAPEPLVFSPACKTLDDLARKHADRQQALMENLNLNRRMVGQGRHGNRLTYLFMLVLEGFWPVIELLGYSAVIALWLNGLLLGPDCGNYFGDRARDECVAHTRRAVAGFLFVSTQCPNPGHFKAIHGGSDRKHGPASPPGILVPAGLVASRSQVGPDG